MDQATTPALDPSPWDRRFVVWFTGLPGAGKSTLANVVRARLKELHLSATLLDGDVFRRENTPELGYSKADRGRNVERLAHAALNLVRSGTPALVAAIAPYEEARGEARKLVEVHGRFVEVHVDAPIDVCIKRDPKGHYRRALAGELRDFTGISAPYERPRRPELVIDTGTHSPAEGAELVLATLADLELGPRAWSTRTECERFEDDDLPL